MIMSAPLLEGRNLTKAYEGVTVVDGVSLAVQAGEICAVIGENGSGKSTLMNMLTGVVRPDGGEIRQRGAAIEVTSPRSAARAGISIVHEELNLVPLLTVADNLMLMRPPGARGIRRSTRAERVFVRSVLARVGLDVAVDTSVRELSVAQCQLLEIAKALTLEAEVIVFDEPTAALPPEEGQRLLTLIEALRTAGKGILFVSHSLEDVLRLADCIYVLRDGRLVAEFERGNCDRDTLIRAMVDRLASLIVQRPQPVREEVVLSVEQGATSRVRDLNFELRAGEILGFAGLLGGGMNESALALCGEQPLTSGTITLDGHVRRFRSPHDASIAGISVIPEERKRDGIVGDRPVLENIHLGRYRCHTRWGLVNPQRLRSAATDLTRNLGIRLQSIDQPIDTLSGGNQQKVLMARCIQSRPRVLIVSSPTRGVDIRSKHELHAALLQLAARGTAIILVSLELEELLSLSHRIAVFSGGRMVTVLAREVATASLIVQWAIAKSSTAPAHAHAA
jgi:ABC-type sugar transport system ATPase subunit